MRLTSIDEFHFLALDLATFEFRKDANLRRAVAPPVLEPLSVPAVQVVDG
jgi:hypothetical protein